MKVKIHWEIVQHRIYDKKFDICNRIGMLFHITHDAIDNHVEAYYAEPETDKLEFNDFNEIKAHIGNEMDEIIYESKDWQA